MAYVAMRGSAAVNGVSRLHGDVSRQIFQSPSPGANCTWRRGSTRRSTPRRHRAVGGRAIGLGDHVSGGGALRGGPPRGTSPL